VFLDEEQHAPPLEEVKDVEEEMAKAAEPEEDAKAEEAKAHHEEDLAETARNRRSESRPMPPQRRRSQAGASGCGR
jgi:hypothetical protein